MTDRRAVVKQGKTWFYVDLNEVDRAEAVSGQTKYVCVLTGSVMEKEAKKQLRWRATHAMVDELEEDRNHAKGLIFYNVEDPGRVIEAIRG